MRLSKTFASLFLMSVLHHTVYCNRVKCPKLSVENGRVKLRARGKMAYFKCRKRFTRLGDKFAVCLQSGKWSHSAPICISRGCPSLGALPNMEVTESYDGAMLKFRCPVGTKRKGPETITCNGRRWSDVTPSCESGLTLSCDFEDEGLCGWSQDESDNFDWTRKSGQTPTMSTGPNGDHTTGSGHYMFIESSSPRKVGDVARLISPTYPSNLKDKCFAFWFHMKGPSEENAVGSLEVYIKPESASLEDIEPEFYMDGNQGDDWQRGFVQIPSQDENFKIVIVGTRKDAFVSDIALDDLSLYNCSDESTTTSTTLAMTTTPALTTTTVPARKTTVLSSRVTGRKTTSSSITVSEQKTTSTTTVMKSSSTSVPVSTVMPQKTITSTVVTTPMKKTRRPVPSPVTRLSTTKTTTLIISRALPTTVSVRTTKRRKTVVTKKVMSTRATTTRRRRLKTSPPSVTSSTTKDMFTAVHNYSNLATDIMHVSPNSTTDSDDLYNTTPEPLDTYTDNGTSSRQDNLFPGTMGNDIQTPPTTVLAKNSSSLVTTDLPNFIPTVRVDNTKQSRESASPNIMPLVIGISAGIVVGMIVIGILAWLWARSQRKKKEREAAEDEMYMLSTGEAATYNYK